VACRPLIRAEVQLESGGFAPCVGQLLLSRLYVPPLPV